MLRDAEGCAGYACRVTIKDARRTSSKHEVSREPLGLPEHERVGRSELVAVT